MSGPDVVNGMPTSAENVDDPPPTVIVAVGEPVKVVTSTGCDWASAAEYSVYVIPAVVIVVTGPPSVGTGAAAPERTVPEAQAK